MITNKVIKDTIYQYTYHPSYSDEDVVSALTELLELRALREDEMQRQKSLINLLAAAEMKLNELRERMRWIPVQEQFPDDDIEVLVFDGLDIFLAIHDDGAWYADGHAVDVIRWMPLPELPEVKEWKK